MQEILDNQEQTSNQLTQSLINQWRKGVEERDVSLLLSLFSNDVTLSTPFRTTPFKGGVEVLKTLKAFDQAVDNFRYLNTIIESETACLFFEGWINGEHLQGVDVLQIDQGGKIKAFEVMARPLVAIQHLQNEIRLFDKV